MTIICAEFIKGAVTSALFPHTQVPEFAFFGRSNAGKSSLINMLLNRKNLVKTGARPGMTREINFFMVNAPRNTSGSTVGENIRSGQNDSVDKRLQSSRANGNFSKNAGKSFTIADLPGYGFAQVPQAKRANIDTMLYEYCTSRTELKTLFFLMDIRREPTEIEQRTLAFFCEHRIHTVLVATKADKISKNSRIQRITALSSFFGCEKESVIITSSTKKDGREKLLQHIAAALRD